MGDDVKTLRLDSSGRDVTDSPGLWDESDAIWHAPLVWSSERPTVAGDYLVRYAANRKNRWLAQFDERDLRIESDWYDGKEFAGPFIIQESSK